MSVNGIGIIKKTDSCPAFGDWAINNGLKVNWSNKKIGDVVLFDFNGNGTSDHIGIVYAIEGNYVLTIEGNTSAGSNTNGGQVQLRKRAKSGINYFVRPKYNDEFTKEMVIAAALAEVGIKESPANSNKVKYNEWFYGRNQSAYWCCTFACWCFAHMRTKPEGQYIGYLPTVTIKLKSKSVAVKDWQKFLKWYFGESIIKADGEFGAITKRFTMAFQALERLEIDGCVGKYTRAAARQYLPKELATQNEMADKIVQEALRISWAHSVEKKTYKNKAKAAYTEDLNKAYPNRSDWGKDTKVGKSCDVCAGVVARVTGADPNMARGLGNESQGQWHDFEKSGCWDPVKKSEVRGGDFIIYKKSATEGHVCISVGTRVVEAGYKHFFPRVGATVKTRVDTSGKKKQGIFRARG